MSTVEHTSLIQNVNGNLAPFRKSQPEVMQSFGQLARAAMTEDHQHHSTGEHP